MFFPISSAWFWFKVYSVRYYNDSISLLQRTIFLEYLFSSFNSDNVCLWYEGVFFGYNRKMDPVFTSVLSRGIFLLGSWEHWCWVTKEQCLLIPVILLLWSGIYFVLLPLLIFWSEITYCLYFLDCGWSLQIQGFLLVSSVELELYKDICCLNLVLS